MTQFIEIGKLINKEKEAKNWVEKFRIDAKNIGKKIKEKIGENATVSVIESYDKQIYIFGRNFARGTEILYGAMGLKMSSNIEKVTSKSGYYPISPEVLSNYVGDYIIFSKNPDISNSFEETKTYKNIDAVKKNRVFYIDSRESFYNDPITLENQLNFFFFIFLGE